VAPALPPKNARQRLLLPSSVSRRCHIDHISYGQLRTHVDAIAQVVNNSHTPAHPGGWTVHSCFGKRAVVSSILTWRIP
jgi:hypothetical protein